MSDFSDTLNRMFQAELATFGAGGAQLRDVIESVRPKIRALVTSGELSIDIDGAIDAELLTIDAANGKQADRVMAALATGQAAFTFDPDPILDVVVTLGKGLRKQWRDITPQDLLRMDELRYENVRKQQDAYGAWRAAYSPVAAVLAHYATVGDAVAAGAFTQDAKSA